VGINYLQIKRKQNLQAAQVPQGERANNRFHPKLYHPKTYYKIVGQNSKGEDSTSLVRF
jgi:hypothetical protein